MPNSNASTDRNGISACKDFAPFMGNISFVFGAISLSRPNEAFICRKTESSFGKKMACRLWCLNQERLESLRFHTIIFYNRYSKFIYLYMRKCSWNYRLQGREHNLGSGRQDLNHWGEWLIYASVNYTANAGILSIGSLRTNFSEILIKIHTLSFKKMHLNMSSGKYRPSCLGLNVLMEATNNNQYLAQFIIN